MTPLLLSCLCTILPGAALAVLVARCDAGESNPLRVGTNVWPGYEPLYLAKQLGYYERASIQLLSFPSTSEVIRAYRNGAIDVAAVTGDEAILLTSTLPDQRVILVTDASEGADEIVAKAEFPSLRDLRGRKIGAETTALGAYVLARALASVDMTAKDVVVERLSVDDHASAFVAGEVKAVCRRNKLRSGPPEPHDHDASPGGALAAATSGAS